MASNATSGQPQHAEQPELVGLECWAATLAGVSLGLLFALLGAIFAIINFVMSPKARLAGPLGLLLWNSIAGECD